LYTVHLYATGFFVYLERYQDIFCAIIQCFCFVETCISPGAVLQGVEATMVFTKRAARLLGIPEIPSRPVARAGAVHQTNPSPSGNKTSLSFYTYQVRHTGKEEEVVGKGFVADADSVKAAFCLRS